MQKKWDIKISRTEVQRNLPVEGLGTFLLRYHIYSRATYNLDTKIRAGVCTVVQISLAILPSFSGSCQSPANTQGVRSCLSEHMRIHTIGRFTTSLYKKPFVFCWIWEWWSLQMEGRSFQSIFTKKGETGFANHDELHGCHQMNSFRGNIWRVVCEYVQNLVGRTLRRSASAFWAGVCMLPVIFDSFPW